MRFYVRDPIRRAAARAEFAHDCDRVARGLPPLRALETDIYVTKRCNLRCSYCYFRDYFDNRAHPLPPDPALDRLKALVDRLAGRTYCLVMLGGEPFSRPDLADLLAYARAADIYSIRVSTNGLYLKQRLDALPLIDRLSVSFDCTRSDEYPDKMEQLLVDIADVQAALGDRLPDLCLSWTTGPRDDFDRHLRPLLDYAVQHRFKVKFLPVKVGRRVDWARHKRLVLQAVAYASPETVTNDVQHTASLSPAYVFDTCLQHIQYYIDFEGQFLYPCDEYPEQKAGSIYDDSLDDLFAAGLRTFGSYPRLDAVCAHCPSGCHSDNSYIFRFPSRQLKDLL
jgi:hypothetical protein